MGNDIMERFEKITELMNEFVMDSEKKIKSLVKTLEIKMAAFTASSGLDETRIKMIVADIENYSELNLRQVNEIAKVVQQLNSNVEIIENMKLTKAIVRYRKEKFDVAKNEKSLIDRRPKRLNFDVIEDQVRAFIDYDEFLGASGSFLAMKSSSRCIQAVFLIDTTNTESLLREVVRITAEESFFVGGENTFVINNDVYKLTPEGHLDKVR